MSKMSELPDAPGVYDLDFIDGDTHQAYTLSLPPDAGTDKPRYLVLGLHYAGEPRGFYGRPLLEQLLIPGLAALNPVICAPVSRGGDWSSAANERCVTALLDHIEQGYKTDPRRRIITGYSMGGVGTWHLIERYPAMFSTAIPISGFKAQAARRYQTPIFAIHSTADALFDHTKLREQIDALAATGCDVDVAFIDAIDHYDVGAFVPLLRRAANWVENLPSRSSA